ncbi:unnamed protein product [Rhizoctonia solani]|uniref:Transmembrane protein 53 n=1 Tax=Rhizoctonia solani TaxID=456999 RepID=A0A8H3BV56_9AGAM|nr:unnamed protein product [Rhizoctonia solani]
MSTTPLSGTVTPSGSQLERSFTSIPGSNVYVSYPSKIAADNSVASGPKKDPTVILIFGWMGAQLPHLYKYTEQYNKLYPLATQILVRAHASYFWGSETTRRAAISPVIKLLRDAGIHESTVPESSGLLVHTFSNGGALNETTLARAIADTLSPSAKAAAIPAQALIYDSLPGVLNIRVTVLAFTAPIRSPAFRAIARILLGILYILGTAWRYLEGVVFGPTEDLVTKLHRELNEPKLLPQHIPRTYIYSDVDELIPAKSVEGHAAKAGQNAGTIKLVKFLGSPHVAHARQDPEKYWDTVVQTWEAALAK